MKNKRGSYLGIIVGLLGLTFICMGLGYSSAYYRVKMTYEDNKPEENIVTFANSNSVDVTFDGGSNDITLENVLPGDSISKTYTLTNNSSTTVLYTINLSNINNTFVNKDIVYSLYEVEDDEDTVLVKETTLPSTQSESVNLIECSSIEKNTTKKYKLVLHYLETNTDQSEDMGKEASASISLGEFDGAKCITNITRLLTNTTYVDETLKTSLDNVVVDETEDKNIRYIGENPNNYVWFNCYNYNDTSTCERWRIIGLMNNVSTVSNGIQSLLKIIRADDITDISGNDEIYWDHTTADEYYNIWDNTELKDYNNKTRTEGGATLRRILNDAYLGTETVNTYSSKTYTYTKDNTDTSLPRGITTKTLNLIEKVNWNVTPAPDEITASTFYTTTGTTWSGYVGLMDPSDYGFATSGGTSGRSTCLEYALSKWQSYSDCYDNSWLRLFNPTESAPQGSSSKEQWTIRPYEGENYYVMSVDYNARIDYDRVYNNTFTVRPVVYLTSNVIIYHENIEDGSYQKPYKLLIQ